MSLPPDQNAPRPVGASAVGDTSTKRPRWLVPLLLAVALIIVAALLFSQCGTDDDEVTAAPPSATPISETATQTEEETRSASDTESSTASATTTTSSQSATATTSPEETGAPVAFVAGQIVTTDGGNVVLPLGATDPAGGLGRYINQQVTANTVAVESVPADEGFWVGSSATDRVFVRFDIFPRESPFEVETGDRVSFSGTVQPTSAGFAQLIGVDASEGADQLAAQAHYIVVDTSTLTLTE